MSNVFSDQKLSNHITRQQSFFAVGFFESLSFLTKLIRRIFTDAINRKAHRCLVIETAMKMMVILSMRLISRFNFQFPEQAKRFMMSLFNLKE